MIIMAKRPQTITRCEKKECPHLSRKGPRGFCELAGKSLVKISQCPLPNTPPPEGFRPSVRRCTSQKCEKLVKDKTSGKWICQISGDPPLWMRNCPKTDSCD
ncbi:predicted protein [Methanosarcina acetivorans C2A]|uniref:Uncharacterized protein n=1 Tax=Methanosarcina acetivorans (strain ATCC 35395 / DSM 2834 / JCM 12185 / C2A) TaxID=188937 RepID=Q8TJI9_METAC|nr:predicted protein [Methanosarcina acetivorans C2A]